jgi:hypothetical protein
MCKWRIVYGFSPDPISAAEHEDQSALNSLGVVDGVFDDGFTSCLSDPENPDDDWDTFVEHIIEVVLPLVSDILPGALGGSWGANYAWDLNQPA